MLRKAMQAGGGGGKPPQNQSHRDYWYTKVMIKHDVIYESIKSKVGLEEEREYQRLFNPKDLFGEALHYLAIQHFKKFIATLYYLLAEKKIKFDLIVGAGDSGILLAKITGMLYVKLNLETPLILNLPVVRYKYTYLKYQGQPLELFDNSVLIPLAKEKLKDLKKIENILYVDDEIVRGVTLKEAIKITLKATDKNKLANKINLILIAEDQDFNPTDFLGNVNLEMYPFAKEIKGIHGVINHIVPKDIENEIKKHFSEENTGKKIRLNMLLDLPSKEKEIIEGMFIPKPVFTEKYNLEVKRKIPNFSDMQKRMQNLISEWIDETIKEYLL